MFQSTQTKAKSKTKFHTYLGGGWVVVFIHNKWFEAEPRPQEWVGQRAAANEPRPRPLPCLGCLGLVSQGAYGSEPFSELSQNWQELDMCLPH